MKTALCLVTLILISVVAVQAQRRQLHYEPEKVTITGRIIAKTFFGPPGYGENPKTDSKETQYLLILDAPIDVLESAQEGPTERRVTRITLVVADFKANPVRPLVGTRARVEGTLFHAITGHHHTRVLISVSSLRAANRGEHF